MNSSQLHLSYAPSGSDKAQMEFYGYNNYPLSGSGQQAIGIPSNFSFFPAAVGAGQHSTCVNGAGGQAPSVPAASMSDINHQSQNPSHHQPQNDNHLLLQQQQYQFQSPFAQQEPQQRRKRPWWMWAIGVVDIIAAIVFTARVVQNVLTKDRFVTDRDTLMWTFFLIFLSLAIQFLMGVGLLVGLRSTEDGTTFWYCQSWICGAYFLFGETGLLLLGTLMKLQSQGNEIGTKLLIVMAKVTFRIVSFLLVRKFMIELRGKPEYRLTMNAQEIEQYQQQRMLQIQQLQQHQDQQQQRQQQQQHQQRQQQQQQQEQQQQQLNLSQQLHHLQNNQGIDIDDERRQSVGGGGRLGGRGSECYYYTTPQMSLMMSMMMNQDGAGGGTVPT